MDAVDLGTPGASGFAGCFTGGFGVVLTDVGAWMERIVVFFWREKGLGVIRGFGARGGLGFTGRPVSMEVSITEFLRIRTRETNSYLYIVCIERHHHLQLRQS